ncbi:hypothetical protein L6164_033379 [Bauhinia variegata]|uniref:Uncharacterized protein n=1 Tax=Bauhinia variegata TaxID=167791 RepID=A0ACB9KRX5_BAUVA|nr:hypothetical protein L6164_033379 [Bauhinia variegata]
MVEWILGGTIGSGRQHKEETMENSKSESLKKRKSKRKISFLVHPTKYFAKVVNKVDESHLYRTWDKVKYVVELARALANTRIYRVDLLTRRIAIPEVDYSLGRDCLALLMAVAAVLPTLSVFHVNLAIGRNKFEQLLEQGRLSREAINATYKIMRRIEAEELGLDAAEMVVTSTRQEIEEQWGLYDGFDLKLERKLWVRRQRGVSCLGRNMPRKVVIPPGMDFNYVTTEDSMEGEGDLKSLIGSDRAQNKRQLSPIWSETLILGNRDDIEEMSNSSSTVLTMVLKLIERYDLYGQVAYPKHHKQSDVLEIYRLAAKTKVRSLKKICQYSNLI